MMTRLEKVCHVVRRMARSDWGGIESAVFNLSQQLVQNQIESPIFSTSALSKSGNELLDGVEIRRFSSTIPYWGLSSKNRNSLERLGGNPLSMSLFLNLLKEKNTSIIHTHVQHRLGGVARTIARMKKIPYVVTLHGGYFTMPASLGSKMLAPAQGYIDWGKPFGWALGARSVVQDADGIICVGYDEYLEVIKHYPNKSVKYIPNGVDSSFFEKGTVEPFLEKYRLSSKTKVILCVARIDEQKNQMLLIKAFKEFIKDFPDYHLFMIGPISHLEYYNKLQEQVKSDHLEKRVFFTPGLQRDDPLLASAYKAADFFVLPSLYEPFGIAILEAWAAGLPVIASLVGGVKGFTKDKENVLHFENNSEKSLILAMNTLARNPSLYRSLREAGSKEVSKFSWNHITTEIIAYYRELIGCV